MRTLGRRLFFAAPLAVPMAVAATPAKRLHGLELNGDSCSSWAEVLDQREQEAAWHVACGVDVQRDGIVIGAMVRP